MPVAEQARHLAGGPVQDAAARCGVNIETRGADNDVVGAFAAKIDEMVRGLRPEVILVDGGVEGDGRIVVSGFCFTSCCHGSCVLGCSKKIRVLRCVKLSPSTQTPEAKTRGVTIIVTSKLTIPRMSLQMTNHVASRAPHFPRNRVCNLLDYACIETGCPGESGEVQRMRKTKDRRRKLPGVGKGASG